MPIKNVILLLEEDRVIDRDLARGIAKYANFQSAGKWAFYHTLEKKIPSAEPKKWKADGIIAYNPNDKAAQKIIKLGIPSVTRGLQIDNYSYIVADENAIASLAASHFQDRGFKHLAYIGRANDWSRERGNAFQKKCQNFCEDFYAFQHRSAKDKGFNKKEIENMTGWLKSLPKPVGVFACNDDLARAAIEACKLTGILIPQEVAILGVDNDTYICELSDPPLSSIALNFENVGYIAARALDSYMSGMDVKEKKILIEPTHIVFRQSTNILAIEDCEIAKALNFIRQNTKKIIQVDDVAAATNLSRRSLERRFKIVLHRSISDEIRFCHVTLISQMLVETKLSISDICTSFGFSNTKHFARYFSKAAGITPLAYRKKYGHI